MREIVFDTETTGLSPLTGDRMVEIGCVELFNKVETGRTFHSYVNPGRAMPTEAEAVLVVAMAHADITSGVDRAPASHPPDRTLRPPILH